MMKRTWNPSIWSLSALLVMLGCTRSSQPEPSRPSTPSPGSEAPAAMEADPDATRPEPAALAGAMDAPAAPAEQATTPPDAAPFLPAGWTLVGPAVELDGVQKGPNEVARAPRRDTVVVFYQSQHHGEPVGGTLWVLDGPTRSVHVFEASSWTFTPDGSQIVMGLLERHEYGYNEENPYADHVRRRTVREVAQRIGVRPSQLDISTFEHGGPQFVVIQPAVLDLATGNVRRLPMVGGAHLRLHDSLIIGSRRPAPWDPLDGDEAVRPRILDLARTRWLPLPEDTWKSMQQAQRAAEEQGIGPIHPSWNETDDTTPGHVYITTLDGSLGIVLVGEWQKVRAFRRVP